MDLNLATLLESAALRHPDNIIARSGDQAISYGDMDHWASRVAAALHEKEIGQGDVVALCCPNNFEFIACLFGILKAGATVMPINFLVKREGIRTQLCHTGARAIFCHGGSEENRVGAEGWAAFAEAETCTQFWRIGAYWPQDCPGVQSPSLEDLLQNADQPLATQITRADACAIISFTSGTTGLPKGVCTSHGAEYCTALATAAAYSYSEQDVALVVIPLFTSIGQALLLNPIIAVGGTLILEPRFQPETTLRAIERNRVTLSVAVPTVYHRLATEGPNAGYDFSSHWRLAIYGGSSMDAETLRSFRGLFKVPVRQAYGLTETRVSAIGPAIDDSAPDHAGLAPAPGFTFRVVDKDMNTVAAGEKGELLLRGPGVMHEYLRMPEANAAVFHGEWFRTGDLVERRDDGLYYIVGRLKDIISRGGYKVYPSDVEAALRDHPHIREAAVFGVPDAVYGEEIAAVVVCRQGAPDLDSSALQDWLRERLPPYMYPRIIAPASALPMTPTGKVKKDALPALLEGYTPA